MNMLKNHYKINYDCGSVALEMHGKPIVHAYCHCHDCRDLLDVPFNSISAWEALINSKYLVIASAAWQSVNKEPSSCMPFIHTLTNGTLDCFVAALDFGSWRRSRVHVPDTVYRFLPWNRTAYFLVGVLVMNNKSGVPQTLNSSMEISA
jgi:hypothetical protein